MSATFTFPPPTQPTLPCALHYSHSLSLLIHTRPNSSRCCHNFPLNLPIITIIVMIMIQCMFKFVLVFTTLLCKDICTGVPLSGQCINNHYIKIRTMAVVVIIVIIIPFHFSCYFMICHKTYINIPIHKSCMLDIQLHLLYVCLVAVCP